MIVEPVEVVLDKPRKLVLNNKALFEAETKINEIRRSGSFGRVSFDYLVIQATNAMQIMRAPFPRDLLAASLWAGIIRDPGEKISFEDIFDIMDNSETSIMDIGVAVFEAYSRSAGKNIKEVPPGEKVSAEEKKKTDSPATGSTKSASPLLN